MGKRALSREEKRRAWLYALLITAGLFVLTGMGIGLGRHLTGPITIPQAGPALLEASQGLDWIDVRLTFDPDAAISLRAVQTLTLTNRTGVPQDAIVLRSYTGAYLGLDSSPAASDELFEASYGATFSGGGLMIDQAAVDASETEYLWLDPAARTVLSLPLDEPWLPGDTRTVSLVWHAAVPDCASRFGCSDGIWALGNLFPTPALWLDGAWDRVPYLAVGDPFRTACVNWSVELTLPKTCIPAAAAYAEPVIHGDTAVYQYEALAARDFALTISDHYRPEMGMEDGVLVIAYAKEQADAKKLLTYSRQALRCYGQRWGDYAYPTYTIAQVDFPYGGMEYPGFTMIGQSLLHGDDMSLEITAAHEAAHQWWGVQVGSDSFAQPWQDESLAVYASMEYLSQYHGESVRQDYIDLFLNAAMRTRTAASLTPGSPLDYFSNLGDYSIVVYDRGANLWTALERLMGHETLNRALADYQARYRFGIASRSDLIDLLSLHAGQDLSVFAGDYLDTQLNN